MAIVRNIQNNIAYEYLGNNVFKNLVTGVCGEVPTEKAQKVFKINVELTTLCNDFPEIKNLINTLKLKIEKQNE